jgi:hypothetical protein
MADLEIAAKPNLIPLIMGDHPLHVPYQAGRTIATWAFKTSMMFQSTMPDSPVIPAEHHRQLLDLRRPPHYSFAFIGRYTGTEYLMGRYHCNPLIIGRSPNDGLSVGPNGYCITLIIGHLIMQVVGARTHRALNLYVPFGFPLFSIWPAMPFHVLHSRNTVDNRTLPAVERALVRECGEWEFSGYPDY